MQDLSIGQRLEPVPGTPAVFVGAASNVVLPADAGRVGASVSLHTLVSWTYPMGCDIGFMYGGTFVPLAVLTVERPSLYLSLADYGPAIAYPIVARATQNFQATVSAVGYRLLAQIPTLRAE
jgi:hypothetical protein